MHWIAHRRRGSKFGHHSFWFALVTPPLLPLALSTSILRSALAPLHTESRHASDPAENQPGTAGDTTVPYRRLLASFLQPAATTMLTAGPLCL
jgi:hypothetical protein